MRLQEIGIFSIGICLGCLVAFSLLSADLQRSHIGGDQFRLGVKCGILALSNNFKVGMTSEDIYRVAELYKKQEKEKIRKQTLTGVGQ